LLKETRSVEFINAKSARNIPGGKTDVNDATWLLHLAAYGLLRASFVPPPPIRELRDLTREIQWLKKFRESSRIKHSSVVTSITGMSSRAMLDALVAGEHEPAVLAGLARDKSKSKIRELVQAPTGRFGEHHTFLTRIHLKQIDAHTTVAEDLTAKIRKLMEPFRLTRELLVTIPGMSTLVADVIIAETGAVMNVLPTAGNLVSWAGVYPGSNESAGRIKSSNTLLENKYLKTALGIAAGGRLAQ
jgi:transposase